MSAPHAHPSPCVPVSSSHSVSPIHPSGDVTCDDAVRPRGRATLAAVLFAVGDAALLLAVAVAGTWVMHRVHETGSGFLAAVLLGMSAATIVQIVLAVTVSPLLGSIESMVPSALVGMTIPALVCAAVLLGAGWHRSTLLATAALFALAFSAWLKVYAWRCRRRFAALSASRPGHAADARGTP